MAFNFGKLSVLVVEDTAPMRKLICSVLEALDVGQIAQADNGDEGFKRFCDLNPDIVIADWMMNPTNGIEMTREIRNNTLSPNRTVPIIIVTGYSALQRVAEARDAGVTEFLIKPFSANDLSKRLAYVINKPRDFIDNGDYFGPDRRRVINPNYSGPFRREDDRKEGLVTTG